MTHNKIETFSLNLLIINSIECSTIVLWSQNFVASAFKVKLIEGGFYVNRNTFIAR